MKIGLIGCGGMGTTHNLSLKVLSGKKMCIRDRVNSDAHSAHAVGRYPETLQMLEEIHFPETLIANRDLETLEKFLEK